MSKRKRSSLASRDPERSISPTRRMKRFVPGIGIGISNPLIRQRTPLATNRFVAIALPHGGTPRRSEGRNDERRWRQPEHPGSVRW